MPTPRRSWSCRLRRICLLLVLGLGTTIAVAWGTEAWSPREGVNVTPSRNTPAEWFVDVPSHWPATPEQYFESHENGRTLKFAGFEYRLDVLSGYEWWQAEVHVGLPLRSLRRVTVAYEPDGLPDDALHLSLVQTGLPLPAWLVIDPAKDRRLPLLPLWPGLVGNTLCYALLWWLALAARRMAIRDRRFRRGLCPICRYDLEYNNTPGCPECGWRRG